MESKKRKDKKFKCKFDAINNDFSRYLQTLEVNELVVLLHPYLKLAKDVPHETIKQIVEMFMERFINKVVDTPFVIAPNNLFLLQSVCDYRGTEYKHWAYKYDPSPYRVNQLRRTFTRDSNAMLKNEIKGSGNSYKVVAEMKKSLEYCNIKLSEELKQRVKENGWEKDNYLTEKINWQIV
jgi:hypothetical protein